MKTKNKRYRRLSGYITTAAAALLILSSSYDNKGTDPKDWNALNKLRIDTTGLGIKHTYSVMQGETILDIAPKVYYKGEVFASTDFGDGEAPLDFSWVIYTPRGSTNYRIDSLASTPAISTVITRAAGEYVLLFTVTEKSTLIQDYCSFTVQVSTDIPDGYVILYENPDGNTDVGIISNDWINPNTVGEKVLFDIFSGSNEGAVLEGKPISIAHSLRTFFNGTKELLIASENDYVAVDKVLFEVTYTADMLFAGGVSEARNITAMGYSGGLAFGSVNGTKEWLIADNTVYYTAQANNSNRSTAPKLGDAMLGNYGELAPWASNVFQYINNAIVVYDQTNTRFLTSTYEGVTLAPFAKESGTPKFDITNTGMKMITTDYGFGAAGAVPAQATVYEYMLMGNGNTRALFVANWLLTSGRAIANYDMSSYPEITEATMITSGVAGPVFYYATGENIYLSNVNPMAGTITTPVKVWTAQGGEEITCIKVHKHRSNMLHALGNPYKMNELLYVATWNETTLKGTVYQIPINPTSGVMSPEDARIYTGFGKVKDMCWKWAY